jgi:hypothetical protein
MARGAKPAGYSGTPLPKKLGLKDGQRVLFIALPDALESLARAADFASVTRAPSWAKARGRGYDLIHAFTLSRSEIASYLPALRQALAEDGMIWASWPKRASKIPTDVTEDTIRSVALKGDLVDVKVAAVDEKWSGLKLVIRVAARKK